MCAKKVIKVSGITCYSCRSRIEKAVARLPGINHIHVDFYRELVIVEFNPDLCSLRDIHTAISNAGYSVQHVNIERFSIHWLAIIPLLLIIFFALSPASLPQSLPPNAAYITLFIVGLLSSLHCVGMCGGIALGQSASNWLEDNWRPTLLYNLGRIISYSMLGGIIGAAGSILDLSPILMAAITIFAGIVTILMGTKMLGLTLTRRLFSLFPYGRIGYRPQNPFLIGLLNGLMPCGPLQAMQVYALGMGSFTYGALAMLSFALGTTPMMIGLGVFIQRATSRYTSRLFKLSAMIVIILGLTMVNRGFVLGGIEATLFTGPPTIDEKGAIPETLERKEAPPYPPTSQNGERATETPAPQVTVPDNVVFLTADQRGFAPLTLHAVKNYPVKVVITASKLNGCNTIFMIPSLNIKRTLVPGTNVIMLPPQSKDLVFTCGMGMIKGKIIFE